MSGHDAAMTENVRQVRPGAHQWTDRDDDVQAALEPVEDHHAIIAALSLVTNDRAAVGPGSMGIFITSQDAQEIIDWLTARLRESEA